MAENCGLTSKSLLIGLLGGNYQAYSLQRERLRRIYEYRLGQNKPPLLPTLSLSGLPRVALSNAAFVDTRPSNVTRGQSEQTNGCKDSSGKVSALQSIAGGSQA